MSNLTVENVYTRQKAKELTKKHFWKLLGMMATVFGIVYAMMLGGSALLSLSGDESIAMVGSVVLMVVMVLVNCGLIMGLIAAMIDLCRGDETITVGRVFSRMGKSLKGFGLSLWISLKMLLWALPGYVLIFFITGSILVAGDPDTMQVTEASTILLTFLPFVIMIIIFALVIPAAYRYMLSNYILADKPETGVFECVKQSKAMMKGHKWQAFKLIVPIFLVMYVIMMVVAFIFSFMFAALADAAAAASVVSIVMFIAFCGLILYFCIRMYLCYCLFYLKRCDEQNPADAPAEEPVQTNEPTQAE